MVKYFIIVILWASRCSMIVASPYTPCESKGEIVSLDVDGCSDDVLSCVLVRGRDAHINISFKPGEDVEDVNVRVFGVLGQLQVPYMINNPRACRDSNLECPLKEDSEVTYMQSFPVLPIYPPIQLEVKWTLVNPSNRHTLICAEIPVRIQ